MVDDLGGVRRGWAVQALRAESAEGVAHQVTISPIEATTCPQTTLSFWLATVRSMSRDALPTIAPHEWFTATDLGDGLTHITEPHVHHYLRCNVWYQRGRDRDVVIDSGLGLVSLVDSFHELFRDRQVLAIATHYHFDHVGGLHEFADRAIHRSEADHLSDPEALAGNLHMRGANPTDLEQLARAGYDLPADGELLTAVPVRGFDPAAYSVSPCQPTRLLDEGDEIDLGDRTLVVMHLPGHSPGSIGLWDSERATLFSGDAVYDGPLLDWADDASVEDYLTTMRRLRDLPIQRVHGGHEASFDGDRLRVICEDYLRSRSAR